MYVYMYVRVCARRCEKTVRNCSSHGSIRGNEVVDSAAYLRIIIGKTEVPHKCGFIFANGFYTPENSVAPKITIEQR